MKKIYIVLTYTGTILSKIIKYYTKREYCHASISLNADLSEMYSFGRYNKYIAFYGGFIKEEVNKGTFQRFKNTKTVIYSLYVTDSQYLAIKYEIDKMKTNKKKYKFNTLGLFAVAFNKKIKRKNEFYCSEFVKFLLDKAEINHDLPEITVPQDFQRLKNLQLIYKGKLRDFV